MWMAIVYRVQYRFKDLKKLNLWFDRKEPAACEQQVSEDLPESTNIDDGSHIEPT